MTFTFALLVWGLNSIYPQIVNCQLADCTTLNGVCLPNDYDRLKPPNNNVTVFVTVFENNLRKVNDFETTLNLDAEVLVYWQDSRISLVEGLDFFQSGWIQTTDSKFPDVIWTPSITCSNIKNSRSYLSLTGEGTGTYLFFFSKC